VSRALVLITDGEDHESHPLDAAKAAAERGVRILAIGFGDEAGSEVFFTDPQTGARTQLRDGDGRPVITRLDGDTLREMALATDGAYIPAGTGALDLKSIYDAHVAPLVRGQLDDRGHAVRRDAFQWALLAGLVFLVASIIAGSGSVQSELRSWGAAYEPRAASHDSSAEEVTLETNRRAPPRTAAAVGTALLVLTASFAQPSYAQEAQPAGEAQAITADGVEQAAPDENAKTEEPGARKPVETRPAGPREGYNEALAYLDTDFDRAEHMLSEARRDAGTDGDVRFRATYNLGWVEVKRAEKLVGEQPQDALARLRRAADWFRDAVRLRPDDSDARHNLDVVLKRILVLADSLAHNDERNLARRLDELIEAQRRVVSGARQLVDRVAADNDPNAVDGLRGEFRQLALEQRKILSDGQSVSRAAREELDVLAAKKDEEKSPQDKVRAAQLTTLLDYANRAQQRLGQARGQMRRREASRSFRRAAAGLTELKRARDQLRGPVEVLDVILADAVSLAQLTTVKSQETGLAAKAFPSRPAGDDAHQTAVASPAVDSANTLPSLAWLTREYLEDDQASLSERTGELTARLRAAAEQPSAIANQPAPQQAGSTVDAQESPSADHFLAMVREALPYLEKGQAAFQTASQALSTDRLDEAAQNQLEAIAALRDARERFLDLRGLIELAYARQTEIQRVLAAPPEKDADEQNEQESQQDQDDSAADSAPSTERTGAADDQAARADETAAGADAMELRMRLVAEIQSENIECGQRLAKLIEAESAALPPPAADEAARGSQPAEPAVQQVSAQRQRLQLAGDLLRRARDEMSRVRALAARPPADGREPGDKSESAAKPGDSLKPLDSAETARPAAELEQAARKVRPHADRAAEHLQELRRLFFSIAEHLRETAQRQAELNDETERAAALSRSDDTAKIIPPLSHRQRELASIARQIAAALQEQAKQPPADDELQSTDPKSKPLEQPQTPAARCTKAGNLVGEAQVAMKQAGEELSEASAPRGEAAERIVTDKATKRDPDLSGEAANKAAKKGSTDGRDPQLDQARQDQNTAGERGEAVTEEANEDSADGRHPQLDQARQYQNTALEKLVEALAVLEPPQPEQQQDQKQENQQSDQSEGQPEKKPDQQPAGLDPSRLLQAVRDREAQRRRNNRDGHGRLQQDPIDKDW
jgi:hypothetical protein